MQIAHTCGLRYSLQEKEGITSVAERTPPIGATDTGKGTAWLRVNQEVPWATALKILELLKGEKEE